MNDKNLDLKNIFDLAVENHKRKQFLVAKNLYNKILFKKPNHLQTIFLLGTLFIETHNYNNAAKLFQKIIAAQPKHALAYNNLGMIYVELGRLVDALMCLKNAVMINPNLVNARNNLCILLRSLTPNKLSEKEEQDFKNLFLILYKRNDIDHDDIFNAAKSVLFNNKNYKQISETEDQTEFLLENKNVKKLIKEDLFLLMIQKSLISDVRIEKLLLRLRKEILIKKNNNRTKDINIYFDFITSLAIQCSFNEYIYMKEKSEINQIKTLQANLEKQKKINELEVAILGCYIPLFYSKTLNKKLANYKSESLLFNDLIKVQVKNINEEQKLKKKIKKHGKIINAVSQKVKKQYEENPYPRWRHIYNNVRIDFLIRFQNQIKPNKIDTKHDTKFSKPNVLIAGCGTGKHLFIADSYLNANILGVDLSLSSLAYAKRKTEEAGLKNINFLQSDILGLKNLKKKFDVIESVGVLHHMKDPTEGLKILLNLLEPHGLLKLGLYSKMARQHITEAKKIIKKNNLKSNIEDIRKFRYEIINLKNNDNLFKKISSRRDFYSTSALRDLMFHKHEYCFTISEISTIISKFRLKFLGFTDSLIKNNYFKIYNEDKKNILLENWNDFEKANPDTFNGMYSFWVKK